MIYLALMLAVILLCIYLPKRTKTKNRDNLKENAEIVSVKSKREGYGSTRTIRTYVKFDDGFEYSSCKVKYGFGTQYVDSEITEKIIQNAIVKHQELLERNK